jgi:GTP1/Obg family GTP-binding protein
MNAAQNMAQGAIQGSGYQSGWNDPRAMMDNRAVPSTPSIEELYDNVRRANQIAKDLMHKIDRTEKKVEMLTGFYTWITEVYPEIAAQHKAMRELYEAANSNENQTEAGP